MSDKKKQEIARQLAGKIGSWDPSAPCVFELSNDRGEFRLGPLSCVSVKSRLCFFAQGENITDRVSDLLGLGLRGDASDGVTYQTFSGRPEKEALEWALRKIIELAPAEKGAPKAELLALLSPLVGSRPRDLWDLGPLARAIENVGGEPGAWGLNRVGFETGLLDGAPDCALSFFENRSSASPSLLARFAQACASSPWRSRQHTRDQIALRLWEMGSRSPVGGLGPIEIFKALPEEAEAGGLCAQLEALELREALKETLKAPGTPSGKASPSL